MDVRAPLCPLDLRMSRCNILQGAMHQKHGFAVAEAKTNKILLYTATAAAASSTTSLSAPGPAAARPAGSDGSAGDGEEAVRGSEVGSQEVVLTTLPEEARLLQWGLELPGRLTPLLIATSRALYIYLVKSNSTIHSLAVRAPLDAAEVSAAAWHPTEPGLFAIITVHGTFVYSLPHKVFAASFFASSSSGGGSSSSSPANGAAASSCDRVCAIKGKFRTCCWSGNGKHLLVAPAAAVHDLRCYSRASLQAAVPDSDDESDDEHAASAVPAPGAGEGDDEPKFTLVELGSSRKVQILTPVQGEDAVVVVSSMEETQLYTRPEQNLFDADASISKVSSSLLLGSESGNASTTADVGGSGGGGAAAAEAMFATSSSRCKGSEKLGRSPLSGSATAASTFVPHTLSQPLTAVERLFSFPAQSAVPESLIFARNEAQDLGTTVHLVHFQAGVAVNRAECKAARLLYPDVAAVYNNPTKKEGILVVGGNGLSKLLTFRLRTPVSDGDAGEREAFEVQLDREWSLPDSRRPKGLAFTHGQLFAATAQPDPNVAFLSATSRRLCHSAQLVALPADEYSSNAATSLSAAAKKPAAGHVADGIRSESSGGTVAGGALKAAARAEFQAALRYSLAEIGLGENATSADAASFSQEGQTVTSTQPGGLGIQLFGPSSDQVGEESSDDGDAGSIGSIDTLVLPGSGGVGAATPMILEISPRGGGGGGGAGGLQGATDGGGPGQHGLGPEELSPALAARFAAFETTVLSRLSALERSIDSRLTKIEAAVCPKV